MENDMEWGPQQQTGLREVGRWLKDPGGKPIFRLFGFAGTGKTRLAKHLAAGVSGPVIFAAYTGKAASVLRSNGIPDARTIHNLIYIPKDRSKERYNDLKSELEDVQRMIHEAREEYRADNGGDPHGFLVPHKLGAREAQLKAELAKEERAGKKPAFDLNMESDLKDAALLVLDEVSMVDEEVGNDLLSFGVPILALGDPAQLPPVKGAGFFTDAQPDVMLTEIHRQAKGNPLIELASLVRAGKPLRLGQYGTSRVLERADPELAMAANQILVGTNATRLATNKRVRQLLGYDRSPLPVEGEKLVCLRNDKEFGLLNGTQHISLTDADDVGGYVNLRLRPEDFPDAPTLTVPAHREHFDGDPETIGYWERRNAQEFTFGHAMTVHKSQGSQWPNVLVINQSDVFSGDTGRRWLYTAITRAQETVTIVGR